MPITPEQITAVQQQLMAIMQTVQKAQRLCAVAKLRIAIDGDNITLPQESIDRLFQAYISLRDLLKQQVNNLP